MPKQKMKLLIIEDTTDAIESWKEDIAEHHADDRQKIEFEYKFARTFQEAKNILGNESFHFIVADLRIPLDATEAEANERHGNEIIRHIHDNCPVMTAVLTGNPTEYVSPGYHVEVFDRAKVGTPNINKEVIAWFEGNRELAQILDSILSEARSLMAKFFHTSVSPRWAGHWKGNVDEETLKSIITRQAASYISEEITHAREGTLFHHEEFFISPSVRERLHTGDLIKEDGNKYSIILSPPCDMRRTYPKGILTAPCIVCDSSFSKGSWKEYLDALGSNKAEAEGKRLEKVGNLLGQNIDKSHHFLPPFNGDGPWMVIFKDVVTRAGTEAELLLSKRIASVSPYFIPNILQRFSSYIGRLGQPDMNSTFVHDAISKILSAATPMATVSPVSTGAPPIATAPPKTVGSAGEENGRG